MKKIWCTILWIFVANSLFASSIEELTQEGLKSFEQKQFPQALKTFSQILQHDAKNHTALYYSGKCLGKLGEKEQALRAFDKFLAIYPNFQSFWKVANCAEELKLYDKAKECYLACLNYQETPEIYGKLAWISQKQKHKEQAWKYRIKRVELELPPMRQLSFKEPVVAGVKTREELEQFLLQEIAQELSEEKLQKMKKSLLAFRLIPENLDIKSMYIRLLTEQIGGFYNPRSKKLFLIAEDKEPGFWERLFQDAQNDSQDRMVLAHEMTHAIQDQYFDLLKLQESVAQNDDKALALSSLIEGDATLAMLLYNSWPEKITQDHIQALRFSMQMMSLLGPLTGAKELANAPTIFRETLIFPYVEGLFFCMNIRTGDDWLAINNAFSNLPCSTEHILHPEKYLAGDLPLDFAGDFQKILGDQWEKVDSNVMGELGCRILFSHFKIPHPQDIAHGWGGDRYFVYQGPNGLGFIWLTVWDTLKDANEFANGYRELQQKKFSKTNEKAFVMQNMKKVFVFEGFSQEQTKSLYSYADTILCE